VDPTASEQVAGGPIASAKVAEGSAAIEKVAGDPTAGAKLMHCS
jgi:hypothetical protein